MSRHLNTVEHIDAALRDCIAACSEAHDICTATVQHGLEAGGDDATPKSSARCSPLTAGYARGCAHAAGSCASACDAFGDDAVMRACAEACRRCVEACRSVGGPSRH